MYAHPNSAAVWTLYLLGQLIHILKRAGMAVRSKSNRISSRLEYVALHWDALLVRVVLCAGLFWVFLTDPQSVTRVLVLLGAGLTADLPVDGGSALIFGYFADSVLDWIVSKIPLLQKDLPAWNDPGGPTT